MTRALGLALLAEPQRLGALLSEQQLRDVPGSRLHLTLLRGSQAAHHHRYRLLGTLATRVGCQWPRPAREGLEVQEVVAVLPHLPVHQEAREHIAETVDRVLGEDPPG